MKSATKLIQLLFIALLSSYPLHLCAENFSDKDSLVKAMDTLAESPSIKPDDFFKKVEQYLANAKHNRWKQIELELILLKVEKLIHLERVSDAEVIFNAYQENFNSFTQEKLIIKNLIIHLTMLEDQTNFDAIKEKRDLLLSAINRTSDDTLKSEGYIALGHSYYNESKLLKGLEYYTKAYTLLVANSDSKDMELSVVLNSLANIYTDLGDIEAAIKYLKQAEVIIEKHNDSINGSVIAFNLGRAYEHLNQAKNAYSSYKRSLQFSLDINDDIGAAWAKNGLARYYTGIKQYDSALTHYLDSIDIFKQSQDHKMHVSSLLGAASSYVSLNKQEQAKHYINLSKDELERKDFDNLIVKENYLTVSAKYYSAVADYKRAYLISEELLALRNDLNKKTTSKNIQRFKAEYEAEAAAAKANVLQQKNELQSLKIAKQSKERYLFIVITMFAIMVILVICLMLSFQVKHRNRYKDMALKDHLTQSPNRRAIIKIAQERFNEAAHTNMTLVLCLIDLDFFKSINDKFGHDVGDEVLKAFSMSCKNAFRKQDRYGRFGGEEWLIVLSDTQPSDLQILFERLHNILNQINVEGISHDQAINFSMGAAQYDPKIDRSLNGLIKRADNKLYYAKEHGRNQLAM